jgi:hypothetical protein
MSGFRSLVALGVIAALAVALWAFYNGQAHPLGSIGYNYLAEFPSFLSWLGTAAVVVVVVMMFRRRRKHS